MSDLERRLRAAMLAAAEQPPAGLIQAIRRRHRRHVRRAGTACVAAVAAIAIVTVPVSRALRSGPAPAGQPLAGPMTPSASSPPPVAAPGTGLRTCASNNNGTMNANWREQSVHAGPVWFLGAREAGTWPASWPVTGRKMAPVEVLVAIRNGATVVLQAAPSAQRRLRFLPAFGAPLQGTTTKLFPLRVGSDGVTLVGCPALPAPPPGATIPESYLPGLTVFAVGYLTDLRRCLPLEVRAASARHETPVTLAVGGGTCPS
jgi:hypothetical protein